MSQFPPFPPSGRYSPSRAYGDHASYHLPPPPPPPSRDYPPYTYPNSGAPAPAYRPYDAYTPDSRPPYAYEQPRRSFDQEHYDPYQPSTNNAYEPGPPQLRAPPPAYPPARGPPHAHRSPPRHQPPSAHLEPHRAENELTLLTDVARVDIKGYTVAVYALPPSHLPIEKYVAMNNVDALDIHRHICSTAHSVWYADGSSRASEGWSAAVEWVVAENLSGKKMRGCVGEGDALDAELGGLCKAAEGFLEAQHQAIKDGKPLSQEVVVFCESQAAIVGIDTSSRPESLRFDKLWRSVCTEFPSAVMKLVWIPRGSNFEGLTLADKIAVVGASNAYLKRRKDGTLPEIYKRYGGVEPAAPGSTEAGPWQRGDADPSRRKSPFDRPHPLPDVKPDINGLHLDLVPEPPRVPEPEDDSGQPREGSIFVTHFPEQVSAKDLGILFAQFGNIVAVDIYHISPSQPRFAFVAYTESSAGNAAIADLNGKPINLESEFARANLPDLAVWKDWTGRLTVVPSEPPRLVPVSLAADFPDLPDWALGTGVSKDQRTEEAEKMEVDLQMGQERDSSPESSGKKRDRAALRTPKDGSSSDASVVESPSPRKRARQDLPQTQATHPIPLTQSSRPPNAAQSDGATQLAHNPPIMPPFPPTLKSDAAKTTPQPVPARLLPELAPQSAITASTLPPTPSTAEKPAIPVERSRTPPRPLSLGGETTSQGPSKRPLTNSASEPQEYPIKVGAKTLRALLSLVRSSFNKVDVNNWIAHACFIASDLDQARRALKDDLYMTDTAFITGRDHEAILVGRGFTPQRVDTFITKVLKVLDGIAMAEEDGDANTKDQSETVEELERELEEALSKYPDQTKEAVDSAARLMEYLVRGKEAQERKRLEVERRVKVLEGMVKIGEVVAGVVRFLLTEDK